jgi:hypothetical protein
MFAATIIAGCSQMKRVIEFIVVAVIVLAYGPFTRFARDFLRNTGPVDRWYGSLGLLLVLASPVVIAFFIGFIDYKRRGLRQHFDRSAYFRKFGMFAILSAFLLISLHYFPNSNFLFIGGIILLVSSGLLIDWVVSRKIKLSTKDGSSADGPVD